MCERTQMEQDLHGTRSSTCRYGRVSMERFFADRQVVTEIGMIVIHSACQIQISRAGVDQAGQSLEGATGAFIGNETKSSENSIYNTHQQRC